MRKAFLFFVIFSIFNFLFFNATYAQIPLPEIKSPTHPDSNKWYSNNNPRIEWMLPRSVDGVNVLTDRKPTTDPGDQSDGWFNHTSYKDIKNGNWYFHVKFLINDEWGPVAHFKFQVDAEKPSQLEINQLDSESYTKGRFSFYATDEISGIDYFAIKIDDGEQKIWRDYGDGVFETQSISLGNHKISVKAFDFAGNFIETSKDFILEKVLPPRIISSRRVFKVGQSFYIRGVTYRNANVDVWVELQGQSAEFYSVQSDSRGLFGLDIISGLPVGNYTIWAENLAQSGIHSRSSEKLSIIIEPNFIWILIAQILIVVALFIPFVAIIVLMMFVVWYLWHKLNNERKSLRKKKKVS